MTIKQFLVVPRTKIHYYPEQHKEYRYECHLEPFLPRFLRCGVIWIKQWPRRKFSIAVDATLTITRCSTRASGAVNFHRVRMILVCLVRTWRLTTVDFTATTLTRPVPIAARLACINSICSRAICRLRRCSWFIVQCLCKVGLLIWSILRDKLSSTHSHVQSKPAFL